MQQIVDWVIAAMNLLGSVGVGLAIFLENVFPPIPSELILPLAGFTASQGEINLVAAIVWSTIGSVAGAYFLYWIGSAVGTQRLCRIADWMWLTKPADVHKSLNFFQKYGSASVFFGRFIPGIRSLISIPAGISRMPLWKFTIWTTIGSAIWNTVLIVLGFTLGENYHRVTDTIDQYSTVAYAIIGIAIVVVLFFLIRRAVGNKDTTK